MTSGLRIDPVFLEQVKNLPVSAVVGQFVKLTRKGAEHVGISPFKPEKTASFTVNDRKGFWHCFATGEHGNAIDFMIKIGGMNFLQAVRYLADMAGLELPENIRTAADGSQSGGMDKAARAALQEKIKQQTLVREQEIAAQAAKFLQLAKTLWKEARPASGSLVETYLARRGIDLDSLERVYGWRVPPSLRFHPSVYYDRFYRGPAMIGVLQDKAGGFTGVHRTWLLRDGSDKAAMETAKKCMGETWGSGIRLSGVEGHCLCGEGLETTLTVMGKLAGRGEKLFGFCGVSLGNIAGAAQGLDARAAFAARQKGGGKMPFNRRPDPERPGLVLPEAVKRLDLLADADGKDLAFGRNMMERAAEKFIKYQKIYDVSIADPLLGQDFNDMAQREVGG